MAAEAHLPSSHNLSLDPTVVALLEQQAEISAKLAILLPQTYGFDTRAELLNLRHKLRVLQTFASERRLPQVTPILSEVEEARHLQYQIECIETVCLDHGHDLHDQRVVDALDTLHAQDAPPGFGDWLRHNLATDDPIPRAWKQRNTLMKQPRESGHGDVLHQCPLPQYRSLKCPDEGCIHYIYGFLHKTGLDQHCRSHTAQLKRDSALSVGGNTPPSPLFDYLRHRRPTNIDGCSPSSPTLPLARPSPFISGLQLPPLVQSVYKRDHHNLLRSYSFGSEHQPRASLDDEPDALLPPLKRSRAGPRLESISELGLLQGTDMCLYCKYSREKCDPDNPCYSCNRNAMEHTSFWSAIGCHKGPLADLASSLVPDFLGPGCAQSPAASPHAQGQNINDFLERKYWFRPEHERVVQTNLDFEDGWWALDLATFPPADPSQPPPETGPKGQPPSVLKVFASSQNMGGDAYNFWQLLKLSGLLSASRSTEALSYPVLYHAKLFLRELLFFDLQQTQPAVAAVPAYPGHSIKSGAYEIVARHSIVRSCATHFLQSLDHVVQRGQSIDPKTWLATFFSLCIFSIIRTILVDMASQKQPADKGPSSVPVRVHALYKATAAIFSGWLPPFLDSFDVAMEDEDRELYSTASMIVKQSTWSERGISSTEDFLLHLGESEMGGVWYGFMRERSFTRADLPLDVTFNGEQQPPPAMTTPPDPDIRTPLNSGKTWTHAEVRAPDEGAPETLTHNGIFANHPSIRDLTTGGGIENATSVRRSDKTPTPLQQTPGAQPIHLANLAKGYMCVEPTSLGSSDLIPRLPLSACGSCISKKRYASFNDAVAHLRQVHFNSYNRDASYGSERPPWPPLFVLGRWTREVRLPSYAQDDHPVAPGGEESSGRMICAPESTQNCSLTSPHLIEPGSPPLRAQRFSPKNFASTHPQPSVLLPLQNQSRQQHIPPFPVSPQGTGTETSSNHPPIVSPRMRVSPMPTPSAQAQKNLPQSPVPSRDTSDLITTASNTDHHTHTSSHRKGSAPLQQTSGSGASNGIAKAEDARHGHRNRCPYPECGRVFKDLPAHMLTHMEERPEKCPIETCEYHTKGFARKYDKNRHALTHYKGTMVCPFCHRIGSDYEKAFNRADVFKRHLTAVHNVEQTPPNSRKSTAASGINRQGLVADEVNEQDATARCSICRSQFVSAQDFYEHLDDCVLNVIVPSAPKDAGEAGGSLIAKTVTAAMKPSQPLKAVATKTMARSGSRSKSSPLADTPGAMAVNHVDQLQGLQISQTAASETTPQEPQLASPQKSPRDSLPKAAVGGLGDNRGRWHGGCDGLYGFHRGKQEQGSEGQEPGKHLVRPELGALKQGFAVPP